MQCAGGIRPARQRSTTWTLKPFPVEWPHKKIFYDHTFYIFYICGFDAQSCNSVVQIRSHVKANIFALQNEWVRRYVLTQIITFLFISHSPYKNPFWQKNSLQIAYHFCQICEIGRVVHASKIEGKMIVKYFKNANLLYLNSKTIIEIKDNFGVLLLLKADNGFLSNAHKF